MIPAMLDAHFSLLNYAFYSKNYHPIIIENEEGITDIGLKYVMPIISYYHGMKKLKIAEA